MHAPPRNAETKAPLRSIANTVSSLSKTATTAQIRAARQAHDAQREILRLRDRYALDPALAPEAPARIRELRQATIDLLRPPTMESWDRYYRLLDAIAAEQESDPAVEGAAS